MRRAETDDMFKDPIFTKPKSMYFKVLFSLLVLIFPKTQIMAGVIVEYNFQAILFYKNEYCYQFGKYFFLWEL